MPRSDCRYYSDYDSSCSEDSDDSYTCKKHKPKNTCAKDSCTKCEKEKKVEKTCKKCSEKIKKTKKTCKKCDKYADKCSEKENSDVVDCGDKKCGNYIIITLK